MACESCKTCDGAHRVGKRSSLPMACVDSRTYHASAVEQAWFSHNAAGRLCQLAKMQRGAIAPWLDYNQRAALGQSAESPRPNELDVLSYWQLPGGRTEYIEPLTGMARHPLVVGGYCGASLRNGSRENSSQRAIPVASPYTFNVSHIVFANACAEHRRCKGGRKLFFDLGWGRFAFGKDDSVAARAKLSQKMEVGSGTGGSLPLFMNTYARYCGSSHRPSHIFDTIHAWEAAPVAPEHMAKVLRNNSVFGNMVAKRALHLHNVPVVIGGGGEGDFLRRLTADTRKEDFVAVKVDIDGGPEMEIVRKIADTPELAELIDELFFECHFKFDGLDFGWGSSPGMATVDECLAVMFQLRAKGIRAHFWV